MEDLVPQHEEGDGVQGQIWAPEKNTSFTPAMGEYCQGWSMWSGAHGPLYHDQDVVKLCIYAMNSKLSSFHENQILNIN